ncbi:patatin-like phospholipase family protein [Comamonas avium]|uniref:Patatin-like phospholipase family protein n=1 Tax=Comamonas avium TaxID=2762231 RepID=A0ABR8SC01_9BURK|nr:patatin-like phospholipase family protein [Comamonas avium]MBD7960997.1 patatin-like phospholipase family protein [Comamonas avium]
MRLKALLRPVACVCLLSLAACGSTVPRTSTSAANASTTSIPTADAPVRIGIALGGGAAKGFAHIGVIKMLEANGLAPDMVAGTSAGSVVGALYASGMDAFDMQQKAVALDEASIRDLQWSAGGLVKGQKLQDYVNTQVQNLPLEKLHKPFVAVATRLEDGKRIVFARGNTGQAVRASSSIPGVFEPVRIGKQHYVDGGIASPVPVDAVRELGADLVIAVDISEKPRGKTPANLLGTMGQSIAIMGQRLGQAELARADVTVRPQVLDIGPSDFTQRAQAIVEGEKAVMAVMPQIREKVARIQAERLKAAQLAQQQTAQDRLQTCLKQRSSLEKMAGMAGLNNACANP